MRFRSVFFSLLGVFLGLCTAATGALSEPAGLPNAFAAFNLEMYDRPAGEQVRLLEGLGYAGIVASTWGRDSLAQVREFMDVPAVREGRFRVYAILWTPNLDQGYDAAWLANLLPMAARLDASLWVAAFGERARRKPLVATLQAVADQCASNQVQMVLYPHYGSAFADAEEGLALLDELQRPAVRLSIHLCHEIMAGNEKRLVEVIARVAPRLVLASINGAEISGDFRRDDWTRALIKPLGEGSCDVRPYVAALVNNGYRGPFLQHTFGLKTPPEEHLASTIDQWRKIGAEVAADLQRSLASESRATP